MFRFSCDMFCALIKLKVTTEFPNVWGPEEYKYRGIYRVLPYPMVLARTVVVKENVKCR